MEKIIFEFENLNISEDSNIPGEKYDQFQENVSNFIENFPTYTPQMKLPDMLDNYLDIILTYIQDFHFENPEWEDYKRYLDKKSILKVIKEILKHKNLVLDIIPQKPSNFPEKKRFYLGLLWFMIGYYISFMIYQVSDLSSKYPLINITQAASNPYLVFLSVCFIYYDTVLDSPHFHKLEKKIILEYTQFFFQEIPHQTPPQILASYLKNNVIGEIKKNKLVECHQILNYFGTTWKKNPQKSILTSILNLFQQEVSSSKIQHQDVSQVSFQNILKCTLLKSSSSITAIFQCLFPDLNMTPYQESIQKFSFLSQILDDLNDMDVDREENNLTYFTYPEEDKLLGKCLKTYHYIFSIRDFIRSSNIKPIYANLNHYFNILVFNYAIAKIRKPQNLYAKFTKHLLVSQKDILKLRNMKTNFLRNLNKF